MFVLGSGIEVSLKDPDHESDFPMKRYAFVEKAVETAVLEVAVPPIKAPSSNISKNCRELCILKFCVTNAGTADSP